MSCMHEQLGDGARGLVGAHRSTTSCACTGRQQQLGRRALISLLACGAARRPKAVEAPAACVPSVPGGAHGLVVQATVILPWVLHVLRLQRPDGVLAAVIRAGLLSAAAPNLRQSVGRHGVRGTHVCGKCDGCRWHAASAPVKSEAHLRAEGVAVEEALLRHDDLPLGGVAQRVLRAYLQEGVWWLVGVWRPVNIHQCLRPRARRAWLQPTSHFSSERCPVSGPLHQTAQRRAFRGPQTLPSCRRG